MDVSITRRPEPNSRSSPPQPHHSRRQQEEEAARRREEAAAAERRRQEKAEAERQRKEAATWDLLSPEEEAAMVQAVERAETAAEEAAMLQELERVEAAYAARAGAASTTGEAPAAAAVEQADGQKESAGQLPPKAPTASVSVKPDPEVCLCCRTPRDIWMEE